MPDSDGPKVDVPFQGTHRYAPTGVLTEEEFGDLNTCPDCAFDLINGSSEQVRLDLANVGTMNDSRSAEGNDTLSERCELDLTVRTCINCGWTATQIEISSYAGY